MCRCVPIRRVSSWSTITPRARVLQSGTLSETDIHRLYAGARVVVFPSFYEGFGFPIVTTFAYGAVKMPRVHADLPST